MPILTGNNRGPKSLSQGVCLQFELVQILAGVTYATPAIVPGIHTGTRVLFWARQTAGAAGGTFQPEFSWRQNPGGPGVVWERVDDAIALNPAGNVMRRNYEHPARRFRAEITAPGGNAITVAYYIVAWAV